MIGLLAAAAVLALGAVRAPARRTAVPVRPLGSWPRRASPPPPWVASLASEAGWPPEALRSWPAARAAGGVLLLSVAVVAGPIGVAITGLGLLGLPWAARPWLRDRRRRRRDQLLPSWLERLASGLRAGLSLPAAISASTRSAPWPLRAELEALDAMLEGGMGLGEALDRWRGAPEASPAVALASAALELGAHAGGSVAQAVDRVAATLRGRIKAQEEVRALATQARASAVLLSVAPAGFTLLLAAVEPGLVRVLFTTPIGWACLIGGLALDLLGAAWMARIVRSAA